ncbi:uncharacterized protein LOC128555931 [Mercenaria mercenaria]|uniref:uncharacterized protein LOC128555931 n=1 Tax=Mercenaria mercenaria TaxID=6596 RepID=UPI00234E4E1C|nr:uncharacterized protein LOC128555931 [Mercenaria mercenaria]
MSDKKHCLKNALKSIKEKFVSTLNLEEDDEEEDRDKEYSCIENVEEKTIRQASPFSEIFDVIATSISSSQSEDENLDESNKFYCPEALQCLLDKFMPIVSLWSGIVLSLCSVSTLNESPDYYISRDTNSPVENWFKYIKSDIKLPKHARPYTFVIEIREAIEARSREHVFKGARKTKSAKAKVSKSNESDIYLNTQEVWKPKKKRNIYHKTPKERKLSETVSTNNQKVMKWVGTYGNTPLSNTCGIDNTLTILHQKYTKKSKFRYLLEEDNTPLSATIKNVCSLMTKEKFEEAKLIWINFTGKPIEKVVNLFGDETITLSLT